MVCCGFYTVCLFLLVAEATHCANGQGQANTQWNTWDFQVPYPPGIPGISKLEAQNGE